jgi:ubiquinone/menaquinone biosynthesis C-methylase UbiE
METTKRVAAAYDQVAVAYAAKNAAMPPAYLELGPRFLEQLRAGTSVLDLGCGAGRDLAWLSEHGARVIGGDRSTGMLAQARPHGASRLVQLDMRALPFEDGVFGGVWCSASLLHLPKVDAPGALAEMRRVLTPDGPFLLGIQQGEGEGWEPSPYDVPVERFFARYQPDEAEAMLRRAGFEIRDQHRDVAPNRRWLTYLSVRGR